MTTFKPATTQEEASNICERANLTLVSYPGRARDKSTVKCNQCGYEWPTTIQSIKRGANCSKCRVKPVIPTPPLPKIDPMEWVGQVIQELKKERQELQKKLLTRKQRTDEFAELRREIEQEQQSIRRELNLCDTLVQNS